MNNNHQTLVCWHATRAGFDVLTNAIKALRKRKIVITNVLYLVQEQKMIDCPELEGINIEQVLVELGDDPTLHTKIYNLICNDLLPKIADMTNIHINVSPGTPAMHTVWLILHCGGRLPAGTRLWSSQLNHKTQRTKITPVEFEINTYLAEVQRFTRHQPELAMYEPQALSQKRRDAFERLKRYALVQGAPILILGERGTGKTRLVETLLGTIKNKKVVAQPCGGLDSELAESLLFGHTKGAFTGAQAERKGALQKVDGGILFLDEIQDLPRIIQRKLVRVFQDRKRRYQQLGNDEEHSVDVELVCASNQPVNKLRELLDPDLFDRVAQLVIEIPPLRDCRADIKNDWQKVWSELRQQNNLPQKAPANTELFTALKQDPLAGNMRDLQRLAVLIMAWWLPSNPDQAITTALNEWRNNPVSTANTTNHLGSGSRDQRIQGFKTELALWAKEEFGTWKNAAEVLECNDKTLRQDSKGEGS